MMRAAREQVVGIAAQPDRLAVANGHDPRAAVGAVERAGAGGAPVVLDGSRSKGDPALTCTWSFENGDGSVVSTRPTAAGSRGSSGRRAPSTIA
jgi:hypothetical protein